MPVIPAEEYVRIREEWHNRRIAALKGANFRCVVCGRRRGIQIADFADGKPLICLCGRCLEKAERIQVGKQKRIANLLLWKQGEALM